ncbi:UDP-4-amino-4,6-dideoxy-N-acetyl-beta-L-altrosamine transaminase [Noviherbaspirillum saxi]|uniref:UDP-4-amino-4, 6-dideoxy-N-acetyl-beta-L-altrosamine transaminase n=1 Tax=Noviherbaspirillum saxi TaxID=2320863 RepID=A0A3A3FS72_9BURK|nr:UDP-4-amino-4,6-dideoxy-N-acetyl-beta-L-altrosamine transaminase [Noviherbaspirillum saxi]RJF98623.1 UDP-4-amino-4,6-dideoxy-N-acetyl-beta-L-altrosamine transaminase [Noviherbaspirillum saxi]
MIPYGRQDISEEDIQTVVDVLRSDFLTQGPAVERFEQDVARYCGVKYAVAVTNATSALHLACLAAGLGQGDVFLTSPNTFVASANCGLYCGASPDFVDIDPRTYNLDVTALEEKLVRAEQQGKTPKLVIPVHFAGQSCHMERIAELSARFGFSVIEDASHAVGGSYLGAPVGSCRFSDMTVFSFHPVKIVTTGEGGMVLTNRTDLYERLICLRSHGITRDARRMDRAPDGPWYYQQSELGFNYRMTDIQAALGSSQLQRLDQFVERRRLLARRYDAALSSLPLTLPWCAPDASSAWHLYVVRLHVQECAKAHREVFEELRARGIGVNLHYIPVHTQPYYRRFGFAQGDFPAAEQYYREAISLPMFYGMSEDMQDQVIDALYGVLA